MQKGEYDEEKNYAAYGSNLNIQQMMWRCPSAKIVGTSEVPDYQLLFKGSRTGFYLTIEPQIGGLVPVAVWEVSASDEQALDHYEGYPAFYYKAGMRLPVKEIGTDVITDMNVFLYIMHEDRPTGVPTWRYMDTCLDGYQDFEFDPQGLMEAYDRSRSEVMA